MTTKAGCAEASGSVPAITAACRRLGRVVGNENFGCMTRLELEVPGWVQARPGQFVLLQAQGSGCFLGRALSVSDQCGQTVSFLIAPVGAGTSELCGLEAGREVWVLGPLGNGFDLQGLTGAPGRVVLVGGGVGVAPFPLLIGELAKEAASQEPADGKAAFEVLVLMGFRDAEQARGGDTLAQSVTRAASDGLPFVCEAVVEDGSSGVAERVTDLLARRLLPGDRVAVCGPDPMSKAVWQICSSVPDVKVWFSMETNMACGVGSCHGCVISLADGSYARVCREGPVFAGEVVYSG